MKISEQGSVPIEDGDNPLCAYFVKEQNKICNIEVGDLM